MTPEEEAQAQAVVEKEAKEAKEAEEKVNTKENTLPDEVEKKDEDSGVKQQLADTQQKLQDALDATTKTREENEGLQKRVKDNREYISRTRKQPEQREETQATMEDYLKDIDKLVDDEFENDPSAGLKKTLRKIVGDIAQDRDFERQENDKRLVELEERAYKKVLALNPGQSKLVEAVEQLGKERPDMDNMTFEQKIEFVNFQNAAVRKDNTSQQVKIERDLASSDGLSRGDRREKTAAWLSDPDVLAAAQGEFESKKELADWADPVKASLKAKQQMQAAQRA